MVLLVEGGDNGVGFVFFDILMILLVNVRVVSVGENDIVEFFEGLELIIMSDGGMNLFGIGGDEEGSFGFEFVVKGIMGNGSSMGYVFV